MIRKLVLFSAALAAVATPLTSAVAAGDGPGGVSVGSNVAFLAEHKLKTSDGKEFSFRDFLPTKKGAEMQAGEVFVITFWSCRCPWSVAWDKELTSISQDYHDQGVRVVGINSNAKEIGSERGLTEVNNYRKEKKVPFPIVLDPNNKIADIFGAKTTPHIYVVDKKGTVVYTGAVDNDAHQRMEASMRKPYLRNALDAILAGQKVELASTPEKGCSIKRAKKKAIKS